MSSTAGAGHVGPLVPFAEACVRAGHEVRIAVPDKALPIVEGAGLAGLPIGYPSEEETGPVWERVERASPEQKEEIVINEVFGRLYTRAALPGMLTAVETWRPDLIVGESGELSSSLAAELHGVPQARVAVTLGLERRVPRLAGAEPSTTCARAGTSRGQRAGGPWPVAGAVAGPSARSTPAGPRRTAFGLPSGRRRLCPTGGPATRAPLAYVTFGTAIPQMDFFPELFRATVDALEDVPARVLFTVGVHRTPAELGPVPANVHVEQWVDQQAVLPPRRRRRLPRRLGHHAGRAGSGRSARRASGVRRPTPERRPGGCAGRGYRCPRRPGRRATSRQGALDAARRSLLPRRRRRAGGRDQCPSADRRGGWGAGEDRRLRPARSSGGVTAASAHEPHGKHTGADLQDRPQPVEAHHSPALLARDLARARSRG